MTFKRAPFDHTLRFELGDPHTTSGGKSRQYGGPSWHVLFGYLIQNCISNYDSIYLLVDTRDLTNVAPADKTLGHWPAVAAWWASRLQYIGPKDEQVDLVFVRTHVETGLELVHPTWAGTFVVAALVFLFPDINFVLLDSDCIPVTLIEVDRLWLLTTGQMLPPSPLSKDTETAGPNAKSRRTTQEATTVDTPRRVFTCHRTTYTDINAGFVVILESAHEPPLYFDDLAREAVDLPQEQRVSFWSCRCGPQIP